MNEIAVVQTTLPIDIERGAAIARQLRDYLRQARMTVRIQGRDHVRIEGWQVLCHLCQLPLPSIVDLRREDRADGHYVYVAEALLAYGGREYRAYGICASDEPNWRGKPEFQLASMAQTRAAGKVLRLLLGWVVTLAGYEPTPAEEMVIEDPAPDRGNAGGAQQQAQSQQRCEESENPMLLETRELARAHLNAEVPRAWLQTPTLLETRELARAHLNAEALRAVLQRYGVERISALSAEQLTEFRGRLKRVAAGETLDQVFPEVFEMDPYFDREPGSGSSEGNGHDREAEMRLSELQQADRQQYNRILRALQAQARQRFADENARREWLHANYGVWSFRDLTVARAREALLLMQQEVPA
jgi:hypothetical protein